MTWDRTQDGSSHGVRPDSAAADDCSARRKPIKAEPRIMTDADLGLTPPRTSKKAWYEKGAADGPPDFMELIGR